MKGGETLRMCATRREIPAMSRGRLMLDVDGEDMVEVKK